MKNYKIGNSIIPRIIKNENRLERMTFETITQQLSNQRNSFLLNNPTVIQGFMSVIFNLTDVIKDIFISKPDVWSSCNNWKEKAEIELCNNNSYYLLFENDKYNSYVKQPIWYNNNYTLPVKIKCNTYGKLRSITVIDKNLKRHHINTKEMITGNPEFKWMLEHVFNTLTFEIEFRYHFLINHQIVSLLRYKLIKKYPNLVELNIIGDDTDENVVALDDICKYNSSKIAPNFTTIILQNVFPPELETYISVKNLKKTLHKSSFETLPFQKIQHKKPIHIQMIKSWKKIHSYVQTKYGSIMNDKYQKIMCSFLFHSFVISSITHINLSSNLNATTHTGLINQPNNYTNIDAVNLILKYGVAQSYDVVLYIQNFIPKDIKELREYIQNIFPTIPIGLGHYKPFLVKNINM